MAAARALGATLAFLDQFRDNDATLWMYENGNPRQWYRYDIDC